MGIVYYKQDRETSLADLWLFPSRSIALGRACLCEGFDGNGVACFTKTWTFLLAGAYTEGMEGKQWRT